MMIHENLSFIPMDIASALEGVCFSLGKDQLNHPLMHSFQFPADSIFLSSDGAIATIESTHLTPLNASYAAAWAWVNHFFHLNGSPDCFEKRICFHETSTSSIFIRIIPAGYAKDAWSFDAWSFDVSGRLQESIVKLRIKTNSSRNLDYRQPDDFPGISNQIKAMSVIELKTLMPTAGYALSETEKMRFAKFRGRRITSYLGARLACKRVSRKLSGNDWITHAHEITTTSDDQILPKCPLTDGSDPFFCSVSHDSRFAIAAASENRIGVDVEELSERILNIQRYFMNDEELNAMLSLKDGCIESSLKIWTIKEAVSKALSINLTDTWKRVTVKDINRFDSFFEVDGVPGKAAHDRIGNHIFTVVTFS